MAKFLVPMFMVVEAESEALVYNKVVDLQVAAIGYGLLQDELLNPKQVSEDEEFHSILDAYTDKELTQPFSQ